MNSYQKLKEENNKLKQQLLIIANDPTSDTAQGIMFMYKFQADLAKCVFIGTPKSEDTGIYEQINK